MWLPRLGVDLHAAVLDVARITMAVTFVLSTLDDLLLFFGVHHGALDCRARMRLQLTHPQVRALRRADAPHGRHRLA